MLPKTTIMEINKICRNFLWRGPDCTPSHALVSWANICFPYDEGGLNIRDLETVNHAAIMRHIWHLVSGRRNLWVQWVQAKLIRGRDFWQLQVPQACSWSWRAILKERKDAVHFVQHLIGNGAKTKMWSDPWHPNGVLYEFFNEVLLYDSTCNKEAPVANIIQTGD
ncbi:RNA-directed DNA polymerase (reverse transcriptase)-related family protein, partial [Thalictrum thalictroides]